MKINYVLHDIEVWSDYGNFFTTLYEIYLNYEIIRKIFNHIFNKFISWRSFHLLLCSGETADE